RRLPDRSAEHPRPGLAAYRLDRGCRQCQGAGRPEVPRIHARSARQAVENHRAQDAPGIPALADRPGPGVGVSGQLVLMPNSHKGPLKSVFSGTFASGRAWIRITKVITRSG